MSRAFNDFRVRVHRAAPAFRNIAGALVAGAMTGFVPRAAAAGVEVVLIDRLDEPRGFCIDIVGYQHRAQPERGLQAHSCYSYQGTIAVDQAFDPAGMADGLFRMPAWNVCMTLTRNAAGSGLALEPCNGRPEQRFDFKPGGEIVPRSAPALCVSAGAGPSRPGGGGSPPHLIRALTAQSCDPRSGALQRWRVRDAAD